MGAKLSNFAVCPAKELEVQWFHRKSVPGNAESGRWVPYDEFENTVIERAFQV